jgi:hypothetical protein
MEPSMAGGRDRREEPLPTMTVREDGGDGDTEVIILGSDVKWEDAPVSMT